MYIGELEELILLAIRQIGEDAYGIPVREAVAQAGRNISVGSLYITLDRLENKGLVEGRQGEITPERGGKPKRYFRLTGEGETALRNANIVRTRLRAPLHLTGGVT